MEKLHIFQNLYSINLIYFPTPSHTAHHLSFFWNTYSPCMVIKISNSVGVKWEALSAQHPAIMKHVTCSPMRMALWVHVPQAQPTRSWLSKFWLYSGILGFPAQAQSTVRSGLDSEFVKPAFWNRALLSLMLNLHILNLNLKYSSVSSNVFHHYQMAW